ncbi:MULTISPECIES: T9SS type A sorting domain-containing protein [Algibacter]|uniref:T9SS type A sorting domain-containing protein n=1 Tax=Algibacter TaxID=261827 RepID=UPI0026E9B738|nr:T9SS type A sorting domain-containing protein [Algibacter lectus]MDO7135999.1 family 16 glycosylhydrolase [Algibacter lectus]
MNKILLSISCLSLVVMSQYMGAQNYPLSDPTNTGNWVLNPDVSDEFETSTINENKWLIQGRNGVYQSNFRGRAPSQFSTDNAKQENGKLKIETRWEPNYNFSPTTNANGEVYQNITTAAVISKTLFQYGYMEIMSKAAKAEITSSFWTTGNQSELDMFEMFGDPQPGEANANWAKRLKFNMISWNPNNPYYLPDGNGPAHTRNIQANFNTADAFHVYGFEWTPNYIKVYIDGVLHPNGSILKSEITNNGTDNNRWVTDVPYRLWFDSETFPWLGLPEAEDLPANYEIEYIRIWQSETLGITNFSKVDHSFKIYPTPFDRSKIDNLKISAPNASEISLFNISGVEMLKINKTSEPFVLQVSNLSPGFYFIAVRIGESIKTKKILIN